MWKASDVIGKGSDSFPIIEEIEAKKRGIRCAVYSRRRRRRRRLKGYPLQVRHEQDWDRGFILLLPQTAALPRSPRLLHCLDQMLAVMSLSQHRVSSSKTVRPRAPCGARCIGHAVSTWSAVCSEAPHSQFGEGARPHLCMDE